MIRPLTSAFWWLLLIVAGLLAITVIAWLSGVDPLAVGNWSGRASEALHPWRGVLTLVRWVLWGALWYRWAWLGTQVFRGDSTQATAQRRQWLALRNRLLGGIAVVEGLILLSHGSGA